MGDAHRDQRLSVWLRRRSLNHAGESAREDQGLLIVLLIASRDEKRRLAAVANGSAQHAFQNVFSLIRFGRRERIAGIIAGIAPNQIRLGVKGLPARLGENLNPAAT